MKSDNTEKAYRYIRNRIVNGEFAPGKVLHTQVLGSEIGISRTPVRDALRQLEAEGLVTIHPRMGASVMILDQKEFEDLCWLRLALESIAAELAATARTETDLVDMRSAMVAMRKMTSALEDSSKEEELLPLLAKEDVHFHVAVINAANNLLLKSRILRLHLINRVISGGSTAAVILRTPQERQDERISVLAGHEAIFAAIEAQDGPRAKAAMKTHLREGINAAMLAAAQRRQQRARQDSEREVGYVLGQQPLG